MQCNKFTNKTSKISYFSQKPTSALVPSPFGNLAAASRTKVRIVTYGGLLETRSECSLALLRLDSFVNTP